MYVNDLHNLSTRTCKIVVVVRPVSVHEENQSSMEEHSDHFRIDPKLQQFMCPGSTFQFSYYHNPFALSWAESRLGMDFLTFSPLPWYQEIWPTIRNVLNPLQLATLKAPKASKSKKSTNFQSIYRTKTNLLDTNKAFYAGTNQKRDQCVMEKGEWTTLLLRSTIECYSEAFLSS